MCVVGRVLFSIIPVLMMVTLGADASCPEACVCKWKTGKQFVECSNKNLITIPEKIEPSTQVLEFSGNNLQTLPREKFLKMGIINLQRIYLSRCRISSIDDRAFQGLSNLVELDLSENLLSSVPTETFVDYPSLMRLTLRANPISALRKAAFNHLSFLTTLELSSCDIDTVEDGAFMGLESLEWLRLDGNKLTTIKGNNVLPNALHGVTLDNNRWQCDCHLKDVHAWLQNARGISQVAEPVCSGPPRLSGRVIRSIPVPELACLPDVSPTTLYLEIAEGKNVSLVCQVSAVPEAHVSWWFQGQVLQNDTMVAPGMHLYYYLEEGTEEKKSELIIYNTNTDDNGTFICAAENLAGTVQANFTIRIVVKEEPMVIIIAFPFEYFLTILVVGAVMALLVLVTTIAQIIRFRRNRRDQHKKDICKEEVLNCQQKEISSYSEAGLKEPPGNSHTVTFDGTLCQQRPLAAVSITTNEQSGLVVSSPVAYGGNLHQVRDSPRDRVCHLEQNPDLINDTSVGKGGGGGSIGSGNGGNRQAADGEDYNYHGLEAETHSCTVQFMRDTADVHLNPGLLEVDYRVSPIEATFHYYSTLPNRPRRSAANPMARMSKEVEFLSRTYQSTSATPTYDQYCPGVRHTAAGYPEAPPRTYHHLTTLPESASETASASLPCFSTTTGTGGAPSELHLVTAARRKRTETKFAQINEVSKGCQTDNSNGTAGVAKSSLGENSGAASFSENKVFPTIGETPEELTESPDEGYVGDGVVES